MNADAFEKILVSSDVTLRDTIACINAGRIQLALVVDASRALLGTISDGDVRRALLAGAQLDESIGHIVHHEPVTAAAGTSDEEILALMRHHSIERVPILDEGRVVDVRLLRELVEAAHDQTVVIVAGGEGKRLRPLTDATPKPMLEVGGKPLLETVLGHVRDAGFSKVVLLVNYQADTIERHFGDGGSLGVDITYVHEHEPGGSAGGLRLMERPERPFVVLNADLLTNVDFDALLRFHVSEGNLVTVGVKQYVLEVPYGVVELDGAQVTALREKPELRLFVNAGIYALSPEAVGLLPERAGELHMTELIDAALAGGERVGSFAVHEYWLDIGHVADYERANVDHAVHFRAS